MLKEIEHLREDLNQEFENGTNDALNYENALKISQELDKLIVRFCKRGQVIIHDY